jgi:quinol monooxygenase YgiN
VHVVVATLRVIVPRSKRQEILQALRAVLATTEVQSECERCHLYRDAQDDRAFLLVQEWTTQSALDRYLRSDLYRTILAVLETASEPPEIRFDTLAQRAGVEVVEIARRP